MKVMKLTGNIIEQATVTASKLKHKDKTYYTLLHGTVGDDLWCYKMGLDYRYFKPESPSDILTLSDNNYFIKPVYSNGDLVKDIKGNTQYVLTIDYMDNHKNDILVLWEIPNKYNYTNIKYNIHGHGSELALGYTGKIRSEVKVKTPAPILEVTGDVELKWSAEDDGHYYSQHISYDYANKNWNIRPIKIEEK